MPARRSDLSTTVGAVALPNPVMTASGTAGHGIELAEYGDLSVLGAVVVKSLATRVWAGNPSPRVHEVGAGMLNSVGLQGPGLERWASEHLPALAAARTRVVVSIWGQSIEQYAQAAQMVRGIAATPEGACISALEVNVSCPNVEDRSRMFAHSAAMTEQVLAATECGVPRWAKLSPNVPDIVEIAGGALAGGANGLTLTNTLLGLAIDPATGRPVLGAGGGGLSGGPVHPVAVRAVWECRNAFPELPIVGVGGVFNGADAVELLMAGADAIQVGTATFRDPTAPWKVLRQLERWCNAHGRTVAQLRQAAGLRATAGVAAATAGVAAPNADPDHDHDHDDEQRSAP